MKCLCVWEWVCVSWEAVSISVFHHCVCICVYLFEFDLYCVIDVPCMCLWDPLQYFRWQWCKRETCVLHRNRTWGDCVGVFHSLFEGGGSPVHLWNQECVCVCMYVLPACVQTAAVCRARIKSRERCQVSPWRQIQGTEREERGNKKDFTHTHTHTHAHTHTQSLTQRNLAY